MTQEGSEVVLAEVPRAPDGLQVPAVIQHYLAVIATALRKGTAPGDVTAGWDGKRWVVALDITADSGLRLFFCRHGKRWRQDPRQPFQLVHNGEDLSRECEGGLQEAIALLLGGSVPAAVPGAAPVRASAARASNAVTVRRATVVRV